MGRPDFSVVGAGVIGSAIAYHLALRGAAVELIDPSDAAAPPSASWASAGGVRSQDRDPREWPLAVEAARRWPLLAEELEAPTGFRAGGHLHLVYQRSEVDELADRVQRERQAGIEVELVDRSDARSLAPGLADRFAAAAYTEGDGQADPRATTRAFREAAVRHGCRLVRVAMTSLEPLASANVVLSAGAWSRRLVELPLRSDALQMLLSEPVVPRLRPTVTAPRLSLKQLPSGAYFIGGGWPGLEKPDGGCEVLPESVSGSWYAAAAAYPPLRETQLAESWCGLEAFTEDGVPLIGRLPERPGVYVAAGFCGHGFQLAPAVGRAVAADLLGDSVPELAPFDPNRFADIG